MTLIDSRVPIELEGTTPAADAPDDPAAALQGSLVEPFDGLSLGTEFYLTVDPFDVVPGESFEVTAHARTPKDGKGLRRAKVELQVPAGWQVTDGNGRLGDVGSREATTTFTVAVPADAAESTRFLLGGDAQRQARQERDHLRGGARRAGRRGHARSGCPTSASSRRGRAAPAFRSSSASSRPSCRSARARRARSASP